jgi:anaerobic selenocysteine-containing dehydrogenase
LGGNDARIVGPRFDQNKAGDARIDGSEFVAQRLPCDLGQRSRQLDSGWPSTDQHERQQLATPRRILLTLGALEGHQHPTTNLERVLKSFQSGREWLPLGVSEIRVARTGSDDERIVVDDVTVGEHNPATVHVDPRHLGEQHTDVPGSAKHPANWRGNIAWRERRGRYLIQERLKDVVIAAIEQRDTARAAAKHLARREASESAADDDYMWIRHVPLLLIINAAMNTSTFATEHSVSTVCPLDCPDSCSLDVRLQDGRITSIDGSSLNPVTDGYICAKVRKFPERVYGPDRLMHPVVRKGPKGFAVFQRTSWDEALALVCGTSERGAQPMGWRVDPALLVRRLERAAHPGHERRDPVPAAWGLASGRTVCAAATGAANSAMYGKMASVTYLDFIDARLIVIWGCNPSATGIHLVPHIREAQRRGAQLIVVDPRTTQLARLADIHLAIRPGTDLPVALAIHRHLFETGGADSEFIATYTRGADRLREKAKPWTFERAAEEAGVDPSDIQKVAELYAAASPALIRCGWGQERNRNGGNASLAILALPAVGGKFRGPRRRVCDEQLRRPGESRATGYPPTSPRRAS